MTTEGARWIEDIVDIGLRYYVSENIQGADFDSLIRQGFVILEQRIRSAAGLPDHYFGKDLIDKAFAPDNGVLQPISPVAAERAGFYNLLLGLFLYYRNPVAHRPLNHTEHVAKQIISLIDLSLGLVRDATEAAVDLNEFVGRNEGQIRQRRDFRVDIDGDGNHEIVSLLELGHRTDGDCIHGHLVPVILKRRDSVYRRIPTEIISGETFHGAQTVELRHVTNIEQPDVVISWAWGETSTITLILRKQNDRYVFARREITPDMIEPYNGPIERGFIVHMRQELEFADVDGDGIDEMIQTLGFDDAELRQMGYAPPELQRDESVVLCRLLKWNPERERIVQAEENLVITKWQQPTM